MIYLAILMFTSTWRRPPIPRFTMNLMSWNVRSLNRIPMQHKIRSLIAQHSLSLLLASWRLESKIAILTSLRSLLSLMGGMTSLTVTTVLLTNDLVRGFHPAKDRARMSLKLDLSKAFDCVQWDFLEAAMLHLNLPPQIVSLIMECVTNPSFSIMINGSPCGFFNSTRGLRQGCPLSP